MTELKNISKSFNEKEVLKSINLTVPRGQIVGLVGSNGVGKTTLLNIIAGYLKPDSGTIDYDDGTIITYMPDVPSFFEYLTCLEYISFLNQNKIKKEKLILYLEKFKIEYNKLIKTLSRGNRQKLALACCLYAKPNLIILDEPFSALDPNGKMEMIKMLNENITSDKIVILSSHSLENISTYCKRVILLKNGSISEDINLENNESVYSYTRFRFSNIDSADDFLAKYGYFKGAYYYIDDNLVPACEKRNIIRKILSSISYDVEEFYMNKTEIGRMFDDE